MMKHIRFFGAAAALAASAVLLAPALAQQGPAPEELAGAPGRYSGQDYDRDWNHNHNRDNRNDWRGRKPDFQQIQRDCSRAGIREAWNRNYYSAQYHDGPRLVEGRYGWEMRGKMRLHDRKGYSYVNTICDIRRGDVRIEFLR
jgi:hypothetical protein